jgi:two-component system OmpR family response regulator
VFGPYSLDTAAVQLWQCTPGQPQTPCLLAAGEMALLLALARHANHALSRQRLLELLGDAFGERHERSIDLRVARLRDRLGDSAVQPAWLITVRGQGYRLQASLQPIGADAA